VMAAHVISILSDSSENVQAEVPIVCVDPVIIPEEGAVFVIPPTRVLDLADYSESLPAEQRPKRHESFIAHDVMVSRWRDRVTIRSSSQLGSSSSNTPEPSSEFLAIPFGRPYRTHPNEPRRLMTARKRVRPFLARRLAWRRVPYHSLDRHYSPDSTSDLSSSGPSSYSFLDASLVHFLGFDTSGQTHSGPSTRVASSRSLDASSLSARPSHKRCRSSTTLVVLSTPVLRSVAHPHAYLLPPRKRFRDTYLPEDSREEHMEIGTTDTEAIADLGIGDGVGAHTEDGIGMGVEIAASDIREYKEEFEAEASMGGTMEIAVIHWLLVVFLSPLEEMFLILKLEVGQMMASGERASLADKVRRLGWENLRVRDLLCIERDRVDSLRHHMALSHKGFFQIRRDRDDTRRRLRRLESFVKRHLGFRINGGNNGNGNPNENDRGVMPVARVCTYQVFVKCQPLNFKGTKRVIGLTRWFEKMETMFHISNCPEVYQVKYATFTLLDSALTWWNSHKRRVGIDAAFAMTWRDLMKLMTEVYCPRNEI
ncbi:hypothetical protein Tco_0778111, partial [Tanacetum coccineum]